MERPDYPGPTATDPGIFAAEYCSPAHPSTEPPPTDRATRSAERLAAAVEVRTALQARLEEEGETELAAVLDRCGQPVVLLCVECQRQRIAEARCRQKWCPVCARKIAAQRAARLRIAARRLEHPAHLTLTVPNIATLDAAALKHLRKSWTRLRHRKIWHRVRGGVACIEVTNKGAGWHPHIHALIDCEWLSAAEPPPYPRITARALREKCQRAHRELSEQWAAACQLDLERLVVWIRRCDEGAAQEVAKYAVKGSDLLEMRDPIGPTIRALKSTRLVSTFGSLYGIRQELAEEAAADDDRPHPTACKCGCEQWIPEAAMAAAALPGGARPRVRRDI